MAVNLSKGGRVNLQKEAPGVTKMLLGLGWDVRKTDGQEFDLDASLLMLDASDKPLNDESFIFYNNKTSPCGGVVHEGDNKTGEGDGDDEVISIDLTKLPAEAEKMVVAVTIHDADARNQNFGQIDNAFIRVANPESNENIALYDMTEDFSTETSLIFGELYRKDGDWRFAAKGDGFAGGLGAYLASYGIES